MMPHIIETERLHLRKWRENDFEPFAEMNNDPVVMEFYPKCLGKEETREMIGRIQKHFDNYGFGLWAVELKTSSEFIGYTGFAIPTFESFFTPCVEIGWRYKKEVWGQGFATEAARACLGYGFRELRFDKIVSFTAAINLRSESVMKRIGMIEVGHFNHPSIDRKSRLCKHVLYEIKP